MIAIIIFFRHKKKIFNNHSKKPVTKDSQTGVSNKNKWIRTRPSCFCKTVGSLIHTMRYIRDLKNIKQLHLDQNVFNFIHHR